MSVLWEEERTLLSLGWCGPTGQSCQFPARADLAVEGHDGGKLRSAGAADVVWPMSLPAPVFSTRALKRMAINCSGVDDRDDKSVSIKASNELRQGNVSGCSDGYSSQFQSLSARDAIRHGLSYVIDAWPTLQPHIREAVLTLIEAAASSKGGAV